MVGLEWRFGTDPLEEAGLVSTNHSTWPANLVQGGAKAVVVQTSGGREHEGRAPGNDRKAEHGPQVTLRWARRGVLLVMLLCSTKGSGRHPNGL
jgi:hypothetical protein